MTTNQTIDGVPRELLLRVLDPYRPRGQEKARKELRALLDAPADTRTETVPKHKFDTLVQHCKRLDGEVAQARAHVNEITLYQQNAVWFWQHDGEDFLESLSCPIIIQPHHLRELLKGVVPAAQHQGGPVYQVEYVGGYSGWRDVDESTFSDLKKDPRYKARIMYAEQPAPVAFVLPERKDPGEYRDASYTQTCMSGEWNACLDEVAKINTHTVSAGLLRRIVGHPLVLPIGPDQIAAIQELSQIGKLNN